MPPELAAWAERVCSIGIAFRDTRSELNDQIDDNIEPGALALGEWIKLWERIKPQVVAVARETEQAYRAVSPPAEAADYLSAAKTTADLDAASAVRDDVRDAGFEALEVAIVDADPPVPTALFAVDGCLD